MLGRTCEEEDAVDIMRDGVADFDGKGEEQDASDDIERRSKDQIADHPSVIECSEDQHELRDNVNDHADGREHQIRDKEAGRVLKGEMNVVLERGDGDEEADAPYHQA